ncbi:hypothetical protein KEJ25_09460 [Candidatus Bathyarchaeota archaeon]|nr:hypothetical protein [Candidatus Bathyarchaeota archaeon]
MSGQLLMFKQSLEHALEEQRRVEEEDRRKTMEAAIWYVEHFGCPLYGEYTYSKNRLNLLDLCALLYQQCGEYLRVKGKSER